MNKNLKFTISPKEIQESVIFDLKSRCTSRYRVLDFLMGGFSFVWKLFVLFDIPQPPVKKVEYSLPPGAFRLKSEFVVKIALVGTLIEK